MTPLHDLITDHYDIFNLVKIKKRKWLSQNISPPLFSPETTPYHCKDVIYVINHGYASHTTLNWLWQILQNIKLVIIYQVTPCCTLVLCNFCSNHGINTHNKTFTKHTGAISYWWSLLSDNFHFYYVGALKVNEKISCK